MKILVLNFSGNVGKSTVSHHVLSNKLNCETISIDDVNKNPYPITTMLSDEFEAIQDKIVFSDSLVIDVGASNIKEFMEKLKEYGGAENDIDYFVIPVSGDAKQSSDTMKTFDFLIHDLNIEAEKIKLIFNRVKDKKDASNKYLSVFGHLDSHDFPFSNVATIPTSDFFDNSVKYFENYDVLLKNVGDELINELINEKMLLNIDYLAENLDIFTAKRDELIKEYKLSNDDKIKDLAKSFSGLTQISRNAKTLKVYIDNAFNGLFVVL